MARPVVDISFLGDKKLERLLKRLPDAVQKKAVRPAIRNSTKRLQPKVAAASPVDEGRQRQLLATAKIRSAGSRHILRVGFIRPEEKQDAIKLNVIEYGSAKRGIPPTRFIRNTVDANKSVEYPKIGREIGKNIEKEARKLGR